VAPDNEVIERLDRLTTLLRIGFGEQISHLREEVQADPVATAILEAAKDDWVNSGDLQRSVGRSAKVSARTVLRSLTSLTERGLLRARGSGRSTSYRSAGVL
jgi:DNA-binding transcriptional ArsR family regulator